MEPKHPASLLKKRHFGYDELEEWKPPKSGEDDPDSKDGKGDMAPVKEVEGETRALTEADRSLSDSEYDSEGYVVPGAINQKHLDDSSSSSSARYIDIEDSCSKSDTGSESHNEAEVREDEEASSYTSGEHSDTSHSDSSSSSSSDDDADRGSGKSLSSADSGDRLKRHQLPLKPAQTVSVGQARDMDVKGRCRPIPIF